MIFWSLALLMLVGALLCVLVPMARKNKFDQSVEAKGIYAQQLADLDASGNPDEEERAEIARRLLRETKQSGTDAPSESKTPVVLASIFALCFVPLASVGLYLTYGTPAGPSQPVIAEAQQINSKTPASKLVQIAEEHLAKNPDDVKGWKVLAGVYARTGDHRKRANALAQIGRIEGVTPTLQVDQAEAIIFAEQNRVTSEAKELLLSALEADPENLRGNVFYAVALEQAGENDGALQIWRKLANERKEDSNWQEMVDSRIQQFDPNPASEPADAIAALPQNERSEMIANMVSGLAERLAEEPDDIEGWLRLVRSYVVLNKSNEARTALKTAKSHFAKSPQALASLDELASELKIITTIQDN